MRGCVRKRLSLTFVFFDDHVVVEVSRRDHGHQLEDTGEATQHSGDLEEVTIGVLKWVGGVLKEGERCDDEKMCKGGGVLS